MQTATIFIALRFLVINAFNAHAQSKANPTQPKFKPRLEHKFSQDKHAHRLNLIRWLVRSFGLAGRYALFAKLRQPFPGLTTPPR